jgi:hypothetical protein
MAVMKSYSFKKNQNLTILTPGVGHYDVSQSYNFTRTRNPSYMIGKSERSSNESSPREFPGPGEYNIEERNIIMTKNHSPRTIFGNSSREYLNKTINWPGPANYTLVKDFAEQTHSYRKIAIRGRNRERSSSNSPGPIYDTIKSSEAIKQSFPKIKIGTGKKIDLGYNKKTHYPGPGHYEASDKMQSTFYSNGSSIVR